MTTNRGTSLFGTGLRDGVAAGGDPGEVVVVYGIANLLCVRATYAREGSVILAPYILYTRGNDRFVDAVALERDGAPPADRKLATFKFNALRGLVITTECFTPVPEFDRANERYAGGIIASVDD